MWKTTDRYVQQVGSLGWAGHGTGRVGHPRALLLRGRSCVTFRVISHKADGRGDPGAPCSSGSPSQPNAGLSDPVLCFKKRLKAAEAESKLKQVYIPN